MANIITSPNVQGSVPLLPQDKIGVDTATLDLKPVQKKTKQLKKSGAMSQQGTSNVSFKGTTPSRSANFGMGTSDGSAATSDEVTSLIGDSKLPA